MSFATGIRVISLALEPKTPADAQRPLEPSQPRKDSSIALPEPDDDTAEH